MEIVLALISVFILGLFVGTISKGVNINIKHTQQETPNEYNESLIEELPPEVRGYYDQSRARGNNFDRSI